MPTHKSRECARRGDAGADLTAGLCVDGALVLLGKRASSDESQTDDAQRLDRRLRSAGALRRTCAINEPKPLLVANADPHV